MKVKVDIISGFLGAGKTTFIKKLITEEYNHEKVVVIENEFGKVNIDGEILKNTGIIVQEITSGCICCSHDGDLTESIKEVVDKFRPDRIIIEPTGVARLSEVLKSLRNNRYLDMIEINNIITILDIKRFKLSLSYSKEFIDNQIKYTKSVLFSKTTGSIDEIILEAIEYIRSINDTVNIINLDWNKASAREIMNAIEKSIYFTQYDKKNLGKVVRGKIHKSNSMHQFSTWEFESTKNFTREKIKNIFNTLSNDLEYGNIIRGKGILKENYEKWVKFDFALGDITFEEYGTENKGRVCVIGIDLNGEKIKKLFNI